jgi:hypothetical protein
VSDHKAGDGALHDGQYLGEPVRIVGEQETQGKRKGQHPLPNWYFRKHMIDQVGGRQT